MICEFSTPTWKPFRTTYRNYLVRALPKIAGATASAKLGLAAVPGGGFVLAGGFSGDVDFGDGVPVSSVDADAFVVRYDGLDQYLWHRTFGGAGVQRITDVAVDSAHAVVVTGGLKDATDFGFGAVAPIGLEDAFVAKLRP